MWHTNTILYNINLKLQPNTLKTQIQTHKMHFHLTLTLNLKCKDKIYSVITHIILILNLHNTLHFLAKVLNKYLSLMFLNIHNNLAECGSWVAQFAHFFFSVPTLSIVIKNNRIFTFFSCIITIYPKTTAFSSFKF